MQSNRKRRGKRRLNKFRFFIILAVIIVMGWSVGYVLAKINSNKSVSADQDLVTQSPSSPKNSTASPVPTVSPSKSTSLPTQKPTAHPTVHPTPHPTAESDDTSNTGSINDVKALKSELTSYIKKFSGEYGIYYYNLVDGTEFGINDTDSYIGASTTKVPLNLYLFKKIAEGKVNPKATITYQKGDYEGGTGVIAYNGKFGNKYTIEYLSKQSIETSDNVATNMLYRYLGMTNIKDFMKQLGGTVVAYNQNITCPRDLGLYMRNVYKFYKENPVLGDQLMDYFFNTIYNDRIPKLLPEDVDVAHKIGNQVGAIHDVGIVFADKPYILAVMSKNINETQAYGVIANISKKIYDFVE
jgi:beta-lactamase class A